LDRAAGAVVRQFFLFPLYLSLSSGSARKRKSKIKRKE